MNSKTCLRKCEDKAITVRLRSGDRDTCRGEPAASIGSRIRCRAAGATALVGPYLIEHSQVVTVVMSRAFFGAC